MEGEHSALLGPDGPDGPDAPDAPDAPDGPARTDGQDGDRTFDYVERFAAVLVAAGFPAMPARVFVALLIAESGRLSAADLARSLRISPAAVSGAVRYLIGVGLVHKERVPGSRRDYYRMPGNMWDDLLRMRGQVMNRWAALVREGIGLAGPDTAAGARMAEQAAFLEFATREMSDLLTRWEKYRAERAAEAG
jgi:DNA-binding transcriptional regulator GbsR (MarR family)